MRKEALHDLSVHVYADQELPAAGTVEQLYAAASSQPPLNESADVARLFAQLYDYSRVREGMIAVGAVVEGELLGFVYGHPWRWEAEQDPWSQELQGSLGKDSVAALDDSFAVMMLAVHPRVGRRGLGRLLLDSLMEAAAADTYWLQTTDLDTPARALYKRRGFRPIGYGPNAPDGRPGLVLMYKTTG